MAEPDPAARRLGRRETDLILRRATEGGALRSVEDGLTLDELAAAAGEAGIDPAAVRRAAALSTTRADPVQAVLAGAPVHPVVRARFPGRLPPSAAARAQHVIEDALGRRGEVETDGSDLEWREEHGWGRTRVSVREQAGEVAVEAEAERKGHLLALMLGLTTATALVLQPLGGFAGLAADVGSLLAVLLPVLAVLAGTRAIFPFFQRPLLRRLEAAALEVGALVEESPRVEGERP